ncbi:hypothetical protein QET40_05825 [Akkermansia sp. N21169]|uniref:hypothetical protein n=1 Tax=Akkermansia sp. N21169 TaxID=3040765 RepID=UPI00244E9A8A|nr:hypothetical protein [Akkermansia sp. N21169]MDH3068631.1 hypothetical protein [Akkermansia sp. N21169]
MISHLERRVFSRIIPRKDAPAPTPSGHDFAKGLADCFLLDSEYLYNLFHEEYQTAGIPRGRLAEIPSRGIYIQYLQNPPSLPIRRRELKLLFIGVIVDNGVASYTEA